MIDEESRKKIYQEAYAKFKPLLSLVIWHFEEYVNGLGEAYQLENFDDSIELKESATAADIFCNASDFYFITKRDGHNVKKPVSCSSTFKKIPAKDIAGVDIYYNYKGGDNRSLKITLKRSIDGETSIYLNYNKCDINGNELEVFDIRLYEKCKFYLWKRNYIKGI